MASQAVKVKNDDSQEAITAAAGMAVSHRNRVRTRANFCTTCGWK